MNTDFFELKMGPLNSLFISINNIAFVQDTADEVVVVLHKNLKGKVGEQATDTDTLKLRGEGAENFRDWFEKYM